ncbi:gluconolactonase protein [Streptomyces laurentii]|uniref:Gluconolactonase protein n=1 Tax=Streptomyces laurentii TaxID=39478 RepID=A0A160P7T2_STRLU|nr:gluconolactonase protein [Streptomyces laurentii]
MARVLDRTTGATDLCAAIEQNTPENRANDAKTDSRGWAWVGTMAYDKQPRNAALYRVDDVRVVRVADAAPSKVPSGR